MTTIEAHVNWGGLVIALVGGDEREREIARLAAMTGAEVRATGFPWPDGGISNVVFFAETAEALKGADIALMPIPGMTLDGAIFATRKIIPTYELLSLMAPNAHIILGKADTGLKEAAARAAITLHEYEHDAELMLLRGPAIVEGVLRVLIENTEITLHDANICIIGQGNIGGLLTNTLVKLGARVTVAARNPVQLAAARAMSAQRLELNALAEHAGQFDIVISTVPAPVVTKAVIDALPSRGVIVDVSAPPGSCDLEYANATGRKGIWARALGRRAPITVGASQWAGIEKIIREIKTGGRVA
jgi:dipicolinate synthase subunit A